MFRRYGGGLILLLGLGSGLVPASLAGATTTNGYPPVVTANPPGPGPFTLNDTGGPVSVAFGSSGSYCVSGYLANTAIAVSVNHHQELTLTSDANGNVCLTLEWLNTNGPQLVINGGSPIAIHLGIDDVALDGQGPNGTVDESAFFDPYVVKTASSGGLAFTGADIAAMVLGGVVLVGGGAALILGSRRRSARRSG